MYIRVVLQADKEFILYVLPGDLRVDFDSFQKYLGVKKLRFASKESLKVKIGLQQF